MRTLTIHAARPYRLEAGHYPLKVETWVRIPLGLPVVRESRPRVMSMIRHDAGSCFIAKQQFLSVET